MSTNTSTIELQRMTQDELRQDIALHTAEYAKMRMGIGMQKEKNHALFKSKRREIARMKTVLAGMRQSAPVSKKSAVSKELPSQSDKKPVKVSRSK